MRQLPAGPSRNTYVGTLFAIGGAEAKLRRRTVLEAFVAAAGGSDARIGLVSSASSLGPEVVEVYTRVFTSLGASDVISLRPESRALAATPLLMSGAVIHILPAGSEFDLASRMLIAHQTAAPDPEVLEACAEADLRDVAPEVAAEDNWTVRS